LSPFVFEYFRFVQSPSIATGKGATRQKAEKALSFLLKTAAGQAGGLYVMAKSCEHYLALSRAVSQSRQGTGFARPRRMTISPPKQVAPYRGRDRDCEAAIMAAFEDLISNLLKSGHDEAEVVAMLENALDASRADSALADDMETVRDWAIHAGWEPGEVDRAFLTLSEVFYARLRARDDGSGR